MGNTKTNSNGIELQNKFGIQPLQLCTENQPNAGEAKPFLEEQSSQNLMKHSSIYVKEHKHVSINQIQEGYQILVLKLHISSHPLL